MPENMKFSIKELRVRKDKTQAEAAKDLGITTTTYNAWENNFGIVKISNARKVAKYYGVTLNDILF